MAFLFFGGKMNLKQVSTNLALSLLIAVSVDCAFAETTIQMPILIKGGLSAHSQKIYQVKDFATVITAKKIELPASVQLSLLNTADDVVPQIEKSIDRLSQASSKKLELATDENIATYVSKTIENKLCYTGQKLMAVKMLPHLADYFLNSSTAWVGYKTSEDKSFKSYKDNSDLKDARSQVVVAEEEILVLTTTEGSQLPSMISISTCK